LTGTAYAKLNLALHVRGKLPDGRHAIETVFAFCEDGDVVSLEPAPGLELTIDGPFGQDLSNGHDNLVLRAATALREAAGVAAGAHIHLTKNLPVASGIGGGSADAAAVLHLLTRLWAVDERHGEAVAPKLGADVPACLLSEPCRGTGAGDDLELVDLGLRPGTPALLINPRIPLATGPVFAGWDGIDRGPLGDWREGRNDLEPSAIALVPEIGAVLAWLRSQSGVRFPRMSGSGATCFALFDTAEDRDEAATAVPANWWHLATRLR
jgi:4-diphosphocytidyl-2-C-methyl-D-erythritol kinase